MTRKIRILEIRFIRNLIIKLQSINVLSFAYTFVPQRIITHRVSIGQPDIQYSRSRVSKVNAAPCNLLSFFFLFHTFLRHVIVIFFVPHNKPMLIGYVTWQLHAVSTVSETLRLSSFFSAHDCSFVNRREPLTRGIMVMQEKCN